MNVPYCNIFEELNQHGKLIATTQWILFKREDGVILMDSNTMV